MPDFTAADLLPALLARSALPGLIFLRGWWTRCRAGWGRVFVLAEFAGLELLALGLPAAIWLPLGLGYALLFTLDHGLHARLGWAPDAQALRFARREPANVRLLLRQEFGRRDAAVLGAGVAAGLLALGSPPPLPAAWMAAALLPALGGLVWAARRAPSWPPVPNLLRAGWQSRRAPQAPGLGPAQRQPLSATPPAPGAPARPDVLLLVIESLSRRVLDSPAGRAAAPRYHGFVDGEAAAGRLEQASRALASSTSSDIAYACLFSGLSPEQPHARFHRNPLLWDAAKAQGYHTALYSSQSLDWSGFEQFLLGPAPDRALYREVLGAPLFNDLAMDDRLLNQHLVAELPRAGQPFFAVVNYNMLHAPFSPGWDGQAAPDAPALQRYLDALRLFDQCFGELLDSLAAAGRLEHTVIALCADHGETPERYDRQQARRMPLRLDQFDTDGLHIPLWLRCPPPTLAPAQRAQLRANCQQQTVASLDLYPTLLALFGVPADTRQALASGHSLLAPLPPGRSLPIHNTGAFRQWACEPFALARAHWLLMYHDLQRRFELRDLRQPEGPDLWPTLAPEARAAWLAELAGQPLMADILARRGLISAPASSAAIAAEYERLAGQAPGTELHRLNNWGLFSLADWQALCHAGADFIGLRAGDRVFEAGCGAGAFLAVLRELGAAITDGIDLSPGLIEVARRSLPGRFHVGDIQDLSCAADASYDRVVAHGVFLYLPSLAACERAALEMIRLARPGGLIYIGLLNDPERLAGYHSPHRPSGNAFVRREFWHALGARLGLAVETVDQERLFSKAEGYDAHARLRYSVRLSKPLTASA